uniref:TMEM87A/B GOLD domain-containing protein n=1 Tax=Oncorhynchus tshawytscha TaxID=74940 RepID=A0AAZ3SCQ0_ONCTS
MLSKSICSTHMFDIFSQLVLQETLKKQSFFFTKTMFNNTVQLKWLTEHCEPPVKLNISWCLRSSRCFEEVFGLHPLKAGSYFRTTTVKQEGCSGFYVFYQYPAIECKQHMTHSEPVTVKHKEMRKRSAENPKETVAVKAEAAVATGKAPAPSAKKQVDWRELWIDCFLAVPLLHHPSGHHVSVEAVCQQPEDEDLKWVEENIPSSMADV